MGSTHLVAPEGVTARGCQLTVLLTANQQVLLKGRSKRHTSMVNGNHSPLFEPCRSTSPYTFGEQLC